jgi:hypothetical protein
LLYCVPKVIATVCRWVKVKITNIWLLKNLNSSLKWNLDFIYRSFVWYGWLIIGVCRFQDSFSSIAEQRSSLTYLYSLYLFSSVFMFIVCFHGHNHQCSFLFYEWNEHAVSFFYPSHNYTTACICFFRILICTSS